MEVAKIDEAEMGATCSSNGVNKNEKKKFGEKSYEKGRIGRPTLTYEGNIETLKITDILIFWALIQLFQTMTFS